MELIFSDPLLWAVIAGFVVTALLLALICKGLSDDRETLPKQWQRDADALQTSPEPRVVSASLQIQSDVGVNSVATH